MTKVLVVSKKRRKSKKKKYNSNILIYQLCVVLIPVLAAFLARVPVEAPSHIFAGYLLRPF